MNQRENELSKEGAEALEAARWAYVGELMWLTAAMLNALVVGGDFHVPDWFDTFGRPAAARPVEDTLTHLKARLEAADE